MILTLPNTGQTNTAKVQRLDSGAPAEVLDFELARRSRTAQMPFNAAMIWQALQDGRVENHYQPQIDLVTGQVIGVEALVRLIDEYGGYVYPDRFIDVAEAHELIVPLGRAVIATACADLAWFRTQGKPLPRMAINIAAKQLVWDSMLPEFIHRELNLCGLKHADLELEITERHGLTEEGEALAQLARLADAGTRIVLDDFGIGYSSLHCLQAFPLAGIKLDRSLVNKLPHCATAGSIVQHMLSLADDLGLSVVAEGIETLEQVHCLTQAGCKHGQGYIYARPNLIDQLTVK